MTLASTISSFEDRAVGAFLGLACGDAYGRTLEFEHGVAVRTMPVDTSSLTWTDDTHMALYLAEAVRAQPPGPLDDDALGTAVGEAFVRWARDPLTPSTVPGDTCTRGAATFRETRDWRTSGVPGKDGCGAVMRVAPVGIAYAGQELDRAARIQALVTHGSPDAADAAVATCRILRGALERGRFDEALVEEVRAAFPPKSLIARALGAALVQAHAAGHWLDDRAIPPHEGGWRSASALGLAVVAALRCGSDGFTVTVDKAARIDGDSDSVAALAGMFQGAAGGVGVIPPAWRVALQDGDRIEAVAQALAVRGQPWLAVSDLHGRPDRLEALLAWMDARFSSWRLVLLGDYLDNGLDVPALLDLVLALQAERGDRVVAIAGNHDVVGSRALDSLGTPGGAYWRARWSHGHWYPGLDTPSAYGAEEGDIKGLADRMPDRHRAFLRGLPWWHDTGRYLFVHAGTAPGPLAPQIAFLAERPARPGLFAEDGWEGGQPRDVGVPPHLRGDEYATTEDRAWDRVVVSAHYGTYPRSNVEGRNRIALRATDTPEGEVMAVLLPDRTYLHALPGGVVEAVHIEEEVTP